MDILKVEERVRTWQEALVLHLDNLSVQYVLTGIAQGFRIGYNRTYSYRQSHGNMQSAIINSKPVEDYLQTEILAGRIVGHLDNMPSVKTYQQSWGNLKT